MAIDHDHKWMHWSSKHGDWDECVTQGCGASRECECAEEAQ